jgi:hypothetical protein
VIRGARWNAVVVWVCAGALTPAVAVVRAQEPHAPAGEDRWVNVDGVRIHYLDFGGQGRTGAGHRRVVHVAPPATDYETDRASILAGLAAAQPGDTVQFAPGT